MGLFNSKKTRVYSTASHLMQMDHNGDQNAILYAILKGQSIPKTLLKTRLNGLNVKANAARNYAKTEYVLGLSSDGSTTHGAIDETVIETAITTDLSLPYGCELLAQYTTIMDAYGLAIPYLIDTRGLDTDTQAIRDPDPAWVALNPTMWDTTKHVVSEYFVVDAELFPNGIVRVTYGCTLWYNSYTNDEGEMTFAKVPVEHYTPSWEEDVPVPSGIVEGAKYLIALYWKLDSNGDPEPNRQFWYYNMDSNLYPDLVPDESEIGEVNSYPVIPIRYENEFISDTNEPEIYSTGSQVLRMMGLDFDFIVSKMEENTDGLADIDHAYVMFGVDLNTDEHAPLFYLVQFFTYLIDNANVSIWDRMDGIAAGYTKPERTNRYTFNQQLNDLGVLRDSNTRDISGETLKNDVINPEEALSLTEHGLRIDVDFDYIVSEVYEGIISGQEDIDKGSGTVGFAKKLIHYVNVEHLAMEETNRRQYPPELVAQLEEEAQTEEALLVKRLADYGTGEYLVLQAQISQNTYREVIVKGLTHTNHIYKEKKVITHPMDIVDDPVDEHNLIIPLHYQVVKRLDVRTQARLYEYSAVLVMNSYVVTKLKWYETNFFRGVVAFVGCVVAMWSGQAWLVELVTVMEAGLVAFALFALEAVITAQVIGFAARILIKMVGPQLGMVIGVILTLAGHFKQNLSNMFADKLLGMGTPVLKAVGDDYQAVQEQVSDDYESWLVDTEEKRTQIEEAQELLHPENLLPFSYLTPSYQRPVPDLAAGPERFYDSVHVGNVGTLSLDVIENYHDVSLLLPSKEISYV